MESAEPRPLAGTDNAFGTPVWSPDSRSIAFFAQGKLQKIEDNGPPKRFAPPPALFEEVSGRAITESFSERRFRGCFFRQRPVASERNRGSRFASHQVVAGRIWTFISNLAADGDHFLYAMAPGGLTETGGIYLGSLSAKPDQQPRKLLPEYRKQSIRRPSAASLAPMTDT
jgi:hypothetical protein